MWSATAGLRPPFSGVPHSLAPLPATSTTSARLPAMVEIVYAWMAPGDEPSTRTNPEALTAPAIQAWGDALLEITAARLKLEFRPPIDVRKYSLFGWLTEFPPHRRAATTAGRVVHRLRVDPSRCAIARVDLIDELFAPPSWRELTEYLVDRGYNRAEIEEELIPVGAPMARALVTRTRSAIESTRPDLVDEVIDYFSKPIRDYLGSWRVLADSPSEERMAEWEVIVPPDGFVEASLD